MLLTLRFPMIGGFTTKYLLACSIIRLREETDGYFKDTLFIKELFECSYVSSKCPDLSVMFYKYPGERVKGGSYPSAKILIPIFSCVRP